MATDERRDDLSIDAVTSFLEERHGREACDVERLPSGFWSSAFAYRSGERELVLRVGSVREGFELDRAVSAYSSADLPIPEVLEIGDAFGAAYAISARHHGRFLETIAPSDATAAGAAIARTLAALRVVPWRGSEYASTWREWLLRCLVDDPSERVSGWRATLAADPDLDELYRSCERRINDLLPACPERHDLVHGDLLNRNVLIAHDASRITAVFSWKCATQGDYLYDIAWCTFWGAWHPGIAALDLGEQAVTTTDGALRHHCYEVHIGARHLAWNAWTHNDTELRAVAAHTERVLDRGPTA